MNGANQAIQALDGTRSKQRRCCCFWVILCEWRGGKEEGKGVDGGGGRFFIGLCFFLFYLVFLEGSSEMLDGITVYLLNTIGQVFLLHRVHCYIEK